MIWLTAVLTGFIEGCAIGAFAVIIFANCAALLALMVFGAWRLLTGRKSI